MSKTLFVGCDVSSNLNTVCLMDPEGKTIGTQTFSNTISGSQTMESWVLPIMNEHNLSDLTNPTDSDSDLLWTPPSI